MIYKILVISTFIFILSKSASSSETDCSQFKKLSAKYIECNAKKLKKSSTQKVNIGKKKLQDSGFGDKLKKFKNSKTLSEVIKD